MSIKKFPLEAYGAAVSREELVQAALDEITKNYREASLSNVARSYGVSLAYVSECVRAQTGRTYKELLQKHRMETAARLLRRSDWNIQQIITYVGYENTSYFYRLFHERYGQSPREYRQSRAARTPHTGLTFEHTAKKRRPVSAGRLLKKKKKKKKKKKSKKKKSGGGGGHRKKERGGKGCVEDGARIRSKFYIETHARKEKGEGGDRTKRGESDPPQETQEEENDSNRMWVYTVNAVSRRCLPSSSGRTPPTRKSKTASGSTMRCLTAPSTGWPRRVTAGVWRLRSSPGAWSTARACAPTPTPTTKLCSTFWKKPVLPAAASSMWQTAPPLCLPADVPYHAAGTLRRF